VQGKLRIDAVLPVGEESPLLDGCLERLAAQTAPPGRVFLVDDSPEGQIADRAGVEVLRSGGNGPYAARNIGWRASDADAVLFLDVRSRPLPEWVERLGAVFEEPAVALASSDVRVIGGSSLGSRVGVRHRFFRRERYTREGLFRPYAPTCNLGVRREALVAADGFKEIRSSADVDLCWRVLADPAKRLVSLPEALMEWVARDRLRDYFEQCYRYGKAHRSVYAAWAHEGGPQKDVMPYREITRRGVRLGVRTARAGVVRRDGDELVGCLREAGGLAYELGYRGAAGRTAEA
jgi:GT2 family glycosyltransferase